jgi:hypothetical protein
MVSSSNRMGLSDDSIHIDIEIFYQTGKGD